MYIWTFIKWHLRTSESSVKYKCFVVFFVRARNGTARTTPENGAKRSTQLSRLPLADDERLLGPRHIPESCPADEQHGAHVISPNPYGQPDQPNMHTTRRAVATPANALRRTRHPPTHPSRWTSIHTARFTVAAVWENPTRKQWDSGDQPPYPVGSVRLV